MSLCIYAYLPHHFLFMFILTSYTGFKKNSINWCDNIYCHTNRYFIKPWKQNFLSRTCTLTHSWSRYHHKLWVYTQALPCHAHFSLCLTRRNINCFHLLPIQTYCSHWVTHHTLGSILLKAWPRTHNCQQCTDTCPAQAQSHTTLCGWAACLWIC